MKDFRSVKRICLETLLKSLINLQKKIINCQLDIKLGQFMEEEFDKILKRKAEKLQASMKYLLRYGRQENLMTCVFIDVTLYINKTQKRNR